MNKKLELLPGGAFTLHAVEANEVYRGRFSMYAIDRFCECKGIESYSDLVAKIFAGMALRDYAALLAYALNDLDRTADKHTVTQAMDILDAVFDGVGDLAFHTLIGHVQGRICNVEQLQQVVEQLAETEEQKKSALNSSLTGSD